MLELRKFDLQFFADGGDTGGGSDAGSNNGGNTGNQGNSGQTGGQGRTDGGKTYSEEEAERIANERAERASRAALRNYFEQQGFTPEEAEKLLKEYKAKKEAAKTEAQRQKERADKAEAEKAQILKQSNLRIAKTEFKVQAIAAGIPADRADDAAALVLDKLMELEPDEKTGEFRTADLKKIAENLVKEKPWLKSTGASTGFGGIGGGANPGGGTNNVSQGMNALIRKMAGRR